MITIQAVKQLWAIMPASEKIGCIVFAFTFPILITAIAVILP